MSAPTRTTFEVKIHNKLENESIWVKVAAELNYATKLETSSSKSGKQERDTSAKTKDETKSSLEVGGSVNVTYAGSGGGASFNYAQSKSENKESENRNMSRDDKSSSKSQSVSLTNKSIEPGFVKVAPLQLLPIPVIVESESQVAYITVYYYDIKSKNNIILANGLQINRQMIEIRRNNKTKEIEISPESDINDVNSKFRTLLLEWGLPEYLCDAMKQSGWDNDELWDDITEQHLIKIGFKDGHRAQFNKQFTKYKMRKQKINKELTYKDLLRLWDFPPSLFGNMKQFGWDDYRLWHKLVDKDQQDNGYKILTQIGFESGHIEKFKYYVYKSYDKKPDDHIKQFEQMKLKLLNKGDDYDDDNKDEFDMESGSIIPKIPTFKINKNKIYHNSFDLELNKIYKEESYIVEMMSKNTNQDWTKKAEISKTKQYRISGLKMNTRYLVRIRAMNAHQKTSEYSEMKDIKTMDEEWKNKNLPEMPLFKYKNIFVYENNDNYNDNLVSIHFDEKVFKEIEEIEEKTINNQKYIIEATFSNDNNINDIYEWTQIDEINKSQLIYKKKFNNINKNENKKFIYLLIRIYGTNDLSLSQYSEINKFNIKNITMYNPNKQCKIALKAFNGKFISIQNGKLIANSDSMETCAKFESIPCDDNVIWLKTTDGKFVLGNYEHRIIGNSPYQQDGEKFRVFQEENRKIGLRTWHKAFFSTQKNGTIIGDRSAADKSERQENEKYTVTVLE